MLISWKNQSLKFLLTFNVNPLSANFTKWSITLKQFVGKLPTNCLSVFDHFVGLALKGLMWQVMKFKFVIGLVRRILELEALKLLFVL